MKICFGFIFSLISCVIYAQEIHLSNASKTNENNDTRLYHISAVDSSATALATIEINGILEDETLAFEKFYKKAKLVGANAYTYTPNLDLDGNPVPSLHKEIKLYYQAHPVISYNQFSVFNSSRAVNIIINGKKVALSPRTYLCREIKPEEDNYISTKKFLGSRLNLHYKKEQPALYYQVLPAGIRADNSNISGGLIIKSGDLISLEKSYADFLTLFYREVSPSN